jgi:hypothetical protein
MDCVLIFQQMVLRTHLKKAIEFRENNNETNDYAMFLLFRKDAIWGYTATSVLIQTENIQFDLLVPDQTET